MAVTAVIGGMGLQSNTFRLNGMRVPPGHKPLAHTRFTPELHMKQDAALRAKYEELGVKYPYDE